MIPAILKETDQPWTVTRRIPESMNVLMIYDNGDDNGDNANEEDGEEVCERDHVDDNCNSDDKD